MPSWAASNSPTSARESGADVVRAEPLARGDTPDYSKGDMVAELVFYCG